MKDLFFKDLSYKALSKYCEMKKAHPRSISFLNSGLSDQRFTHATKRKEGVRL